MFFAPSLVAGCQFSPASSQTGASLAAVHSPTLHNKAASQTPLPDTLQPLHHDSVTLLRERQEEKVGSLRVGQTNKVLL